MRIHKFSQHYIFIAAYYLFGNAASLGVVQRSLKFDYEVIRLYCEGS